MAAQAGLNVVSSESLRGSSATLIVGNIFNADSIAVPQARIIEATLNGCVTISTDSLVFNQAMLIGKWDEIDTTHLIPSS